MKYRRLLQSLLGVVMAMAHTALAENIPALERFPAEDAHQGVAIDERHAYTINNASISKYDRFTGERITSWKADPEQAITHLNAGIVRDGKLYCAHSNYPLFPMRSSIEIFDTKTLTHIGRQDLGVTDGSLTWVDWHNGFWWACFAHYSKRGGDPEKGHEFTRFVQFDDAWKELSSWTFPSDVLDRFAPYSSSGGAWISDKELMVTGHDLPEGYLLRIPVTGSTLEYVATVPVPFFGQAIDCNPQFSGQIYGILRKEKTVVTFPLQKLTGILSKEQKP